MFREKTPISLQVLQGKNEKIKNLPADVKQMDPPKMKIVVFGPFNAGKSTFIQTIDPGSRHVEAECDKGTTTVAIDYGRTEILGRQIYLFGTPGQERFEFVRDITEKGMDAAILILDCSSEVDEFTKRLYNHLIGTRVPVGIMMNKCDLEESCPSAVKDIFPDARTFEISARDPKISRDALEKFVESL